MSINNKGEDTGHASTLKVARPLAGGIMALAALVLAGWAFDIAFLKGIVPGWPTMKPNTAMGFLLSGAGLWSIAYFRSRGHIRTASAIGNLAAVLVLIIGLMTLAEYVLHLDFGLDQWLFDDSATPAEMFPGRMSNATAVCFILSGLSLLLYQTKWACPAQSLSMMTMFIALTSVIAHALDARLLVQLLRASSMALHTSLAFVMLGIGTLLLRPDCRATKLIISEGYGSILVRRLVPLTVLMALLLGWMKHLGTRKGWLPSDESIFIYAIAFVLALIGMLFWMASVLNRMDEERAKQEQQVRELNAQLEQRVERRTAELREAVNTLQGEVQSRIEAEKALRLRDEHYRVVTETLPQLVWTCLPDGRCDYLSPQWVSYTGIPEAQQLDYGWLEQLHPEDRERVGNEWRKAHESGVVLDVEFRIRRFDGLYEWFKTRAVPLRNEFGEIIKWFGTNTDVEELRSTQEELREANAMLEQRVAERTRELRAANDALRANESLLREFIAHAPAAIAMFDNNMCYVQASNRWLSDYQLAEQNIVGRSHYEVFPDIPERWKQIHQRVLAGAIEKCDEDPFPRAEGGVEWLQWEARPWRRANGDIGGLIFFTQVITSRKEMETRLLQQNEELARSNSDLQQFAYVASHDLQEPLRAVAGCLEILQRRYGSQLDSKADELIFHAVDGAKRMQVLINDLLAYSRVNTNTREPVSSADAFNSALANLQLAIAESGAQIERGELPVVFADRAQLALLFQNLVGNAIKYRKSHAPRIIVSVSQEPEHWRFSVRDNGIGIEPRYFERIFGVFQRLHTRSEYPGTGIGLAICKKIVERHGGSIRVKSVPGEGSCFQFTLPSNLPDC